MPITLPRSFASSPDQVDWIPCFAQCSVSFSIRFFASASGSECDTWKSIIPIAFRLLPIHGQLGPCLASSASPRPRPPHGSEPGTVRGRLSVPSGPSSSAATCRGPGVPGRAGRAALFHARCYSLRATTNRDRHGLSHPPSPPTAPHRGAPAHGAGDRASPLGLHLPPLRGGGPR